LSNNLSISGFCQGDKKWDIILELNRKIVDSGLGNSIAYESDSIRHLSVFLSADTLVVFRNEFSFEKFDQELKPLLIKLKGECRFNSFISVIGCNTWGAFSKNIMLRNQLKSFDIISKEDSFYNYSFFNLNKDISITH
jgi:hypothetical protein